MDNTHLPRPSWMWYLGFVNFQMLPSLADDHLILFQSSHLFLAFAYFPSTSPREGGPLSPVCKKPVVPDRVLSHRGGSVGLSLTHPAAPQVVLVPASQCCPCWTLAAFFAAAWVRGRAGKASLPVYFGRKRSWQDLGPESAMGRFSGFLLLRWNTVTKAT